MEPASPIQTTPVPATSVQDRAKQWLDTPFSQEILLQHKPANISEEEFLQIVGQVTPREIMENSDNPETREHIRKYSILLGMYHYAGEHNHPDQIEQAWDKIRQELTQMEHMRRKELEQKFLKKMGWDNISPFSRFIANHQTIVIGTIALAYIVTVSFFFGRKNQ